MNELDTRAERFLESIRAEGEAACAAIRTETDAEIERQLEETRKAQQTKAEHTLHFETDRAHTRANRELSAARMQARAKLAAQRQQIAADAFAAARTQLAAFAAGILLGLLSIKLSILFVPPVFRAFVAVLRAQFNWIRNRCPRTGGGNV